MTDIATPVIATLGLALMVVGASLLQPVQTGAAGDDILGAHGLDGIGGDAAPAFQAPTGLAAAVATVMDLLRPDEEASLEVLQVLAQVDGTGRATELRIALTPTAADGPDGMALPALVVTPTGGDGTLAARPTEWNAARDGDGSMANARLTDGDVVLATVPLDGAWAWDHLAHLTITLSDGTSLALDLDLSGVAIDGTARAGLVDLTAA